jgi:ubiquinone/menaquinone biosynthesis C-methylase UbiE
MHDKIINLFTKEITINKNRISFIKESKAKNYEINQNQTEKIFSNKWDVANQSEDLEKVYSFQLDWFLNLYGFASEDEFRVFLSDKDTIVDTGCGLGYKAAWFAKLAPHAIVIGIDISDSIEIASDNFRHISNLYFLKEDIANTGLKDFSINFTVCDQVIMHTEVPENTFKHLSNITRANGQFACYVYSKKALPRELVDEFFRTATHNISKEKMWEFSEQLTELGKRLSELNINFTSPDIPLLGIKGGNYDIQRFIYWNFLKCFWKQDWGFELSKNTNYDWYAPSNAKRFSKDEFIEMSIKENLSIISFHEEEACYSARFRK